MTSNSDPTINTRLTTKDKGQMTNRPNDQPTNRPTDPITKITTALANAVQTIETEQDAPLTLEQYCVIYDLCTHLNIDPAAILTQQSLDLIIAPADLAPIYPYRI